MTARLFEKNPWANTTMPGSVTGSTRILQEVRKTGVPFVREAPQGDAVVCGLGFMMGDRRPRQRPIGFGRGLYGLLYARRRPGEWLFNGAAVFANRAQAEQHAITRVEEGWRIYVQTWDVLLDAQIERVL